MADHYKCLGQVAPAAAIATTLYTVPAATMTVSPGVIFCNQGAAPVKIRLWVAVNGAADAAQQYLYYDLPIGPSDTFTSQPLSLNAGDLVRVQTDTTGVSIQAFGDEIY